SVERHVIQNRTTLYPWQLVENCSSADQPRYAGGANGCCSPALSEGISVRPARGGNPAPGMVVHSESDHSAFTFRPVGKKICVHLDQRWFATESPYREAGQAAQRIFGSARPRSPG